MLPDRQPVPGTGEIGEHGIAVAPPTKSKANWTTGVLEVNPARTCLFRLCLGFLLRVCVLRFLLRCRLSRKVWHRSPTSIHQPEPAFGGSASAFFFVPVSFAFFFGAACHGKCGATVNHRSDPGPHIPKIPYHPLTLPTLPSRIPGLSASCIQGRRRPGSGRQGDRMGRQ